MKKAIGVLSLVGLTILGAVVGSSLKKLGLGLLAGYLSGIGVMMFFCWEKRRPITKE